MHDPSPFPIAVDEFHVFLSHNSTDKDSVRKLKSLLEERGIKCWFDEDELQPGVPWPMLLEAGIRHSRSVIVAVADSGVGPWEEEEMNAALMLAVREKRRVIPVLLPGSSTTLQLPMFLSNRTWVDLRAGYTTDGLNRLIWGITGRKGPASLPAPPPPPPKIGRRLILGAVISSVGLSPFLLPWKKLWKQPYAAPVKISVGLKQWIGYTPFAVASEMNLFPEDIEITYKDVKSAKEIHSDLERGDIQIGLVTIADLVIDAESYEFRISDPNRPVALFMIDTSRGAHGIVGRKEITSIEELLGKKFLIQSDDVSEFMLQRYCAESKTLDYDDLKKTAVNETVEDAPRSFRDDPTIAAAGTYEPHISRTLDPSDTESHVSGAHVVLDSGHHCVEGKIVDISIAKDSFLSQNNLAIRSLMIGWFRAVDLLNNTNVAQSAHDKAMQIACRFNAEPKKGDRWSSQDWPSYDPISVDSLNAKIKGLAGTDSKKPWPDLEENKDYFERGGAISSLREATKKSFEFRSTLLLFLTQATAEIDSVLNDYRSKSQDVLNHLDALTQLVCRFDDYSRTLEERFVRVQDLILQTGSDRRYLAEAPTIYVNDLAMIPAASFNKELELDLILKSPSGGTPISNMDQDQIDSFFYLGGTQKQQQVLQAAVRGVSEHLGKVQESTKQFRSKDDPSILKMASLEHLFEKIVVETKNVRLLQDRQPEKYLVISILDLKNALNDIAILIATQRETARKWEEIGKSKFELLAYVDSIFSSQQGEQLNTKLNTELATKAYKEWIGFEQKIKDIYKNKEQGSYDSTALKQTSDAFKDWIKKVSELDADRWIAKSKFHIAFEEWKGFLKKIADLNPKDFDGSVSVIEISEKDNFKKD